MRAASILSTAIALAASAISQPLTSRAAQSTLEDFEITSLVLSDIRTANTTLTFNVYDPDPLTNATATCTATWKHNSTDYPQGIYEGCGNSTFAWRLESVSNLRNFTIGIEHSFVDPGIGQPPYDVITNFGRAAINKTEISCQDVGGRSTCRQIDDIIYADIYGSIA